MKLIIGGGLGLIVGAMLGGLAGLVSKIMGWPDGWIALGMVLVCCVVGIALSVAHDWEG
ncbi:MAG: hypothetical protein ABL308_12785 [Oceanicaulis sp.]